jgi:type IV pilus assembly protein PilM
VLLNRLKSLVKDPPPSLAVEVSESGIAAAQMGARTEMQFVALRPGTLVVSPTQDNVIDGEDFEQAVRSLAKSQAGKKFRDVAVIVPDYSTRTAVLDFDSFPSDAKEQVALLKFRLKRSVPFDIESAAISYWAQPAQKRFDVLVVVAPLEVVARYEAPFRAAGMNPGLITPSGIAALELAEESGLNVVAKLAGRVLTLLVREHGALKLVRCLELGSTGLEEVASLLAPTFAYVEDNLGGRAEKLLLCGFGSTTSEAERYLAEEFSVAAESVRSPLGVPGETNAGLLGYLRSIARTN